MSMGLLGLIVAVMGMLVIVCAAGKSKRETDTVLEKYRELLAAAREANAETAKKPAGSDANRNEQTTLKA